MLCAWADENSLIILPSVPFGHDGGLTVNLWLKKDNTTSLAGNAFQYLFSVSSLVNNRFAEGRWELSNQVTLTTLVGSFESSFPCALKCYKNCVLV